MLRDEPKKVNIDTIIQAVKEQVTNNPFMYDVFCDVLESNGNVRVLPGHVFSMLKENEIVESDGKIKPTYLAAFRSAFPAPKRYSEHSSQSLLEKGLFLSRSRSSSFDIAPSSSSSSFISPAPSTSDILSSSSSNLSTDIASISLSETPPLKRSGVIVSAKRESAKKESQRDIKRSRSQSFIGDEVRSKVQLLQEQNVELFDKLRTICEGTDAILNEEEIKTLQAYKLLETDNSISSIVKETVAAIATARFTKK